MAASRVFHARRIVGLALVALSAASIVQSVREMTYQDAERRSYREDDRVRERQWKFGGHRFDVVDDRPTVSHTDREAGRDGTLQLLVDGRPLGPPSRAVVREARTDLGRYFTYLDATVFEERASGRTGGR